MAQTRDKPCPACQAQPGDPCMTGNGRPTTYHHARVMGVTQSGANRIRPKKTSATQDSGV